MSREDMMVDYYTRGVSIRNVARIFGVGRHAVNSVLRERGALVNGYGLSSRRERSKGGLIPNRIAVVRIVTMMHGEGYTESGIARDLSMDEYVVNGIVSGDGEPERHGNPVTLHWRTVDDMAAAFAEEYAVGDISMSGMAAKYGISKAVVMRRIYRGRGRGFGCGQEVVGEAEQ
jgi:predicted DNA-binding protein YlxM (UPF0122 family)